MMLHKPSFVASNSRQELLQLKPNFKLNLKSNLLPPKITHSSTPLEQCLSTYDVLTFKDQGLKPSQAQ